MPVLSTMYPTLLDYAKLLDPNGKSAKVVNLLAQSNEMLDDMVWEEGNLPTGMQITQQTGLPTVYFKMINAGTPPSTAKTAQIVEQSAMLEAFSQVDKKLAKLGGSFNRLRLSMARPFVEAMNQKMQSTLIYGNLAADPASFPGLAVRYSSTAAGNGANIIKAGGAGSVNTSVYLCVWGPNTMTGFFPIGSKAGIEHQDMGEVLIQNAAGVTGALMPAMIDRWGWDAGLAIRDWRSCVRICNIDVTNLIAQVPGTAADLRQLMIRALYRIPNIRAGKAVFYMNRTAAEFLDIERIGQVTAGGGITYDNVDGRQIMYFRKVPIKIVDAITNNEATVV